MNHHSTDDKATEAVISADTGSTSGITSQLGDSFQDFLDWRSYGGELDGLGFLNVCVGVNHVQVGVDLLGPTQKSYRDTLRLVQVPKRLSLQASALSHLTGASCT